jgi:predicted amidohydrolase YtcJ
LPRSCPCSGSICRLAAEPPAILLKPAAVFDAVDGKAHPGWQVLVRGEKIAGVGPALAAPADARVVDLPGATLLPGLIEGHGHLFLHPYNETPWDDQVLHDRWRCAPRARWRRRAPRCWRALPASAIWAPRARAMPMWG